MDKKHEEKLLDHNYDGIQELDNPLPAWWVYLFYITVVFGVIYLFIFSFFVEYSGYSADRKVEELLNAGAKVSAAAQSNAPAAAAANESEESEFEHDEETMDAGKKVFDSKCLACHGAKGEGLVGPNLTDNYWIHGKGTEQDIYKVVIEGVPEKGMLAWKPLLTDEEIRAVTVYVKSLQGTKPANPKDPQGELVA